MKLRPINFKAHEVRAIREGRKTQMRRAIKFEWCSSIEALMHQAAFDPAYKCPYGQPGDRLWVRETWAQVHPIQVSEGRFSLKGRAGIPGPPPVDYRVIYRADGEYPRIHFQDGDPKYPYRELCVEGCKREHIHPEERWNGWAASAFMPRWASRITLEIVSVRVERLNDISEEDAKSEGCEWTKWSFPNSTRPGRSAYRELWESIHGTDSWDLNPWVWVVEFKEVK